MPETDPGPAGALSSGSPETVPVRSIVQRARVLPLPRKLLLIALLLAGLVLVLHSWPRPYRQIPGRSVLDMLRVAFADLALSYRDSAALQPVPGEASLSERASYRTDLWFHQAGILRELLLRGCELAALGCLACSVAASGWRWRRTRKQARERGERVEPRLLRVETEAGVPIPPASVGLTEPDPYSKPENLVGRTGEPPGEAAPSPPSPEVLLHETGEHLIVRPSDKPPEEKPAKPEGGDPSGEGSGSPPPQS